VFHSEGHHGIMILQIRASDLTRTENEQYRNNSLYRLGMHGFQDLWLSVLEIAPALNLDNQLICSSEWLACGGILRTRNAAVWPIIKNKLYFQPGQGKDLLGLLTMFCGLDAPFVPHIHVPSPYTFDWEDHTFVEAGAGENQVDEPMGPMNAASMSMAGLRPYENIWGGYAGYLRGVNIVD
jgi:hypothetical protein